MDDILGKLRGAGFTFDKRYGQNFITDASILAGVADDAGLTADDVVLEIGAGAGTLTRELARRVKRVVAFEIDRRLEPVLGAVAAEEGNVELVFGDVTKATEAELDGLLGADYKAVANLPYYITTPLIFMLLERKNPPKSVTVMVQREVAERIVATEKRGDYGALSVAVALRADAKITRFVGRENFTPAPNVDSAVVRMDVRAADVPPPVARLVQKAFAMKRKTLVNNLVAGYGMDRASAAAVLERAGLKPTVRAEQLPPEKFVELAEIIKK